MRAAIFAAAVCAAVSVSSASAGEADVVSAKAAQSANGSWRFSVTVRHSDAGWDHYADAWEVLGPKREVIARRILAHPHVDEQPFTRSLSGVEIPETIDQLTIRARDSVHGYGGAEVVLTLDRRDSR
ncbi:MAG: hypothetical protein AAGJ87_06030 [Pseudomonadota bacterium]